MGMGEEQLDAPAIPHKSSSYPPTKTTGHSQVKSFSHPPAKSSSHPPAKSSNHPPDKSTRFVQRAGRTNKQFIQHKG